MKAFFTPEGEDSFFDLHGILVLKMPLPFSERKEKEVSAICIVLLLSVINSLLHMSWVLIIVLGRKSEALLPSLNPRFLPLIQRRNVALLSMLPAAGLLIFLDSSP